MGNCCEYQVNYIKTHLTLILIAVYKDNQQGEQMRCFLTPFSLQTNKCMFRKAGNYHHNHSSEMTRLQDETKEESLTLMGRPSKAHIFFQYIVYAILKRKRALLQGDQSVVYLLKKIELLFFLLQNTPALTQVKCSIRIMDVVSLQRPYSVY